MSAAQVPGAASGGGEWGELLRGFVGSPRFTHALTTLGIGLAVSAYPVQRLIGWAGLLGGMAVLLALMGLSLSARRDEVEWRGTLPISLLAFLGWATASLIWSEYQWATLGGLAYLFCFTAIAIYVALSRDTIQIVRTFGDVARAFLAGSLVMEIFSGLLIDAPVPLFNIQGLIALGGPISGLASTRNQLGLIAIVAAISFATEHRTRSVPRLTSVLSLVLAGVTIVFTQSPVILGAALMVGIAAAAMYGLRRVRAERRQVAQFIALGFASVGAIAAWALRTPLVDLFNATGVLTFRLSLWNKVFDLVKLNGLEGWGWIGRWRREISPFPLLTTSADRPAQSALNGYLDIWFQLGIIGLVLFVGMLGLAFVRSWLLAGARRSVVYAWPAAVLVALLIVSLAESSLLSEFGWMTFVICCLKASQELSWRRALQTTAPPSAL